VSEVRSADVIVVGAGAAGLKAALDLTAQGRSVIVLEAKDRVGGRLKATTVAGRTGDLGGQWVGAGHEFLMAEAARYGVALYSQYDGGKTIMQMFDQASRLVCAGRCTGRRERTASPTKATPKTSVAHAGGSGMPCTETSVMSAVPSIS
jgi:monoamine oxidase